jgi:hypothetical protein
VLVVKIQIVPFCKENTATVDNGERQQHQGLTSRRWFRLIDREDRGDVMMRMRDELRSHLHEASQPGKWPRPERRRMV